MNGLPSKDWADGKLGGPDDDHYAKLGVQPIDAIEAWTRTWPVPVAPHLAEIVWSAARAGTKGQAVRDLRKIAWLAERAARVLVDDGWQP